MTASLLDRRHAREVELAMELQSIAFERQELDARDDQVRRREFTFFKALCEWLKPLVDAVPGGRRAWAFLAGLADARKTRDTLERLDDAVARREVAAATELAGLLDGAVTGGAAQ